jgi:hypothetical protein
MRGITARAPSQWRAGTERGSHVTRVARRAGVALTELDVVNQDVDGAGTSRTALDLPLDSD